MSFDQADEVRSTLGEKWNYILKTIKIGFSTNTLLINELTNIKLDYLKNKDIKLLNLEPLDNKPYHDFHEGPAIMYPELKALLCINNYRIELKIRMSVTVCVPPNHSKIWVRISCVDSAIYKDLTSYDLVSFFDSSNLISRVLANILQDNYAKSLISNRIDISLKGIHEIEIETGSLDLEDIAELLVSDRVSMAMIIENKNRLRVLSDLLRRTYNTPIDTYEDFIKIHQDLQWINMRITGPDNDDYVGIYSKHHEGNTTRFIGLVHQTKSARCKEGFLSRVFSKRIVQQISPGI